MDTHLASKLLATVRAGYAARIRALVPCTGFRKRTARPMRRAA